MPRIDIHVGSIGPAFSYIVHVPRTVPLPSKQLYYKRTVRLTASELHDRSVTMVVVTETDDVAYYNTVRQLFGEAIYDQLIDSSSGTVRLKRENSRTIEVTDQQVADINEVLLAEFGQA